MPLEQSCFEHSVNILVSIIFSEKFSKSADWARSIFTKLFQPSFFESKEIVEQKQKIISDLIQGNEQHQKLGLELLDKALSRPQNMWIESEQIGSRPSSSSIRRFIHFN